MCIYDDMKSGHWLLSQTLPNGLCIHVYPIPRTLVATVWIWYRIGARHDPPGRNGLAHWIEHLWFSGDQAEPDPLRRVATRYGGRCNGGTTLDYTYTYVTVPAYQLRHLLPHVIARMQERPTDPGRVEHERAIILAEITRAADQPLWRLHEAVRQTAFQVHPYRNSVRGTPASLQAITLEDLYVHTQTYYRPNNAVLVVVGAVAEAALLDYLVSSCTLMPAGAILPATLDEPPQTAERRLVIPANRTRQAVEIVYRGPPCRHPDSAPMLVLDAILSGAKSPSFGHGIPMYRQTRLQQQLVETGLASHATSRYSLTVDPYLFELSATVQLSQRWDIVEAALLSTIRRIQEEGVSDDELRRAQKQLSMQWACALERVESQAWLVGRWAMLADGDTFFAHHQAVSQVSAADIQRVAQTYLQPSNQTVGWLRDIGPAHN